MEIWHVTKVWPVCNDNNLQQQKFILTLRILMNSAIRLDIKNLGCIKESKGKKIIIKMYFIPWRYFLSKQTRQTLMQCSILLHFIWVFAVCHSKRLRVSSIQRVNLDMLTCGSSIHNGPAKMYCVKLDGRLH